MNEELQRIILQVLPGGLPSREEILAMKNDQDKLLDLFLKQKAIISKFKKHTLREIADVESEIYELQKETIMTNLHQKSQQKSLSKSTTNTKTLHQTSAHTQSNQKTRTLKESSSKLQMITKKKEVEVIQDSLRQLTTEKQRVMSHVSKKRQDLGLPPRNLIGRPRFVSSGRTFLNSTHF